VTHGATRRRIGGRPGHGGKRRAKIRRQDRERERERERVCRPCCVESRAGPPALTSACFHTLAHPRARARARASTFTHARINIGLNIGRCLLFRLGASRAYLSHLQSASREITDSCTRAATRVPQRHRGGSGAVSTASAILISGLLLFPACHVGSRSMEFFPLVSSSGNMKPAAGETSERQRQ